MAVATYTSRPHTTEVAGAVRLMLCDQRDADCNRLCIARRSHLAARFALGLATGQERLGSAAVRSAWT